MYIYDNIPVKSLYMRVSGTALLLLEGSQASPACPHGTSKTSMKDFREI